MNKNLYKVIFNKKRGQMMAVAEIAISEGKSAGERTADSSANMPQQTGLSILSFSLMLAVGGALLLPVHAQARIVGDNNAPSNQRPVILNSANGTPQVNIQTPSKSGVSMNQYQQFDVNKQGAILNNSRTNTQTQLGGWVQGNPFLATGPARVIVNQVNSANPSHLNGYIEVAGQKAEVIIANPAGLRINGGGFINASGVTLTTGTPVVSGAGVDAFRVRRGSIDIGKDGLDTSGADYTRLISQASQLQGGIWAKKLDVTVGNNDVAANGAVTATEASKGQPLQWGIDVGQLGGMYAGKITLISTDKGVGVNNAGQIFASAGGVSIDANGQLTNSGSLIVSDKEAQQADQAKVTIKATDVTNSGTLSSQGKAQLQTRNLSNSGLIASSNELNLRNQTHLRNSGDISAKRLDIQTGSLDNQQGVISQTGSQKLTLSAGTLSNLNKGVIGALPEGTSSNQGSQTGGQSGQTAQHTPSTAAGGGNVALTTNPSTPVVLADGHIEVSKQLTNDAGQIIANGEVNLSATDGLSNHGQMTLGSLQVRGKQFDNDQGELNLSRLDSETDSFSNRAGLLNVKTTTDIRTQDFSNTQGSINSGDNISLSMVKGDNQQGEIATSGKLSLNSDGWLNNQQGSIRANQAVKIHSQGLNNQDGEVASIKEQLNIDAQQGAINNTSGSLQAAKAVDIKTHGLNSQQGTISGDLITINTNKQAFNNASGKVISQTDLSIQSGSINNQQGQIQANGNVELETNQQQLNNLGGQIVAGQSIELQSGEVLNQQGLIAANAQINIDTAGQQWGHLRKRNLKYVKAESRQVANGTR